MKFIALLSFLFLVAFVGQTFAEETSEPSAANRYHRHHRRPHRRPNKKPCGSNGLGDYKGGCDVSVPVLVMPKGRPIMERVLDWFNCENCDPAESEGTIATGTGTLIPVPITPTVTVTAPGTGTGWSYQQSTPSDYEV